MRPAWICSGPSQKDPLGVTCAHAGCNQVERTEIPVGRFSVTLSEGAPPEMAEKRLCDPCYLFVFRNKSLRSQWPIDPIPRSEAAICAALGCSFVRAEGERKFKRVWVSRDDARKKIQGQYVC